MNSKGRLRKPGVLVLTPFFSPNVGGVETHLDDLVAHLDRKGYPAHVLTYTPLTVRARAPLFERRGRVQVHRVPWIGGGLFHALEKRPALAFLYLSPVLFLAGAWFLLRRGREVDVIHAQGFNAAWVARHLARLFKKRAVASTHAIYDLEKNPGLSRRVRGVLSGFDAVLTLSEPSRRELVRIGLDPARVSVYTYWVDQKRFRPQSKPVARKRLGLPAREKVVLFVGRLIEKKGARVLLDAARRLPGVTFAFAGTGPMEGEIRHAAQSQKNVVFFGGVSNSDLPAYYGAADLVAVPSQYSEGFGRVILEANSCGVPVVGSDLGAIPDAVGKTGVVVPPTADGFVRAIRALVQKPARLARLSRACLARAKKRFGEGNARVITGAYEAGAGRKPL